MVQLVIIIIISSMPLMECCCRTEVLPVSTILCSLPRGVQTNVGRFSWYSVLFTYVQRAYQCILQPVIENTEVDQCYSELSCF